jgi:hypothetical protein
VSDKSFKDPNSTANLIKDIESVMDRQGLGGLA